MSDGLSTRQRKNIAGVQQALGGPSEPRKKTGWYPGKNYREFIDNIVGGIMDRRDRNEMEDFDATGDYEREFKYDVDDSKDVYSAEPARDPYAPDIGMEFEIPQEIVDEYSRPETMPEEDEARNEVLRTMSPKEIAQEYYRQGVEFFPNEHAKMAGVDIRKASRISSELAKLHGREASKPLGELQARTGQ